MKKYNVAIIGYGKMGKVYADCFNKSKRCSIVSIYNHSPKRKEEIKKDFPDAKFYTSWERMLDDEEIDIVGLCSATYERKEQIEKAVSKQMHIICEMPICMDLLELNTIKKIIKHYPYVFRVASELKYHPVIVKVSDLIKNIGEVLFVNFHYSMFRTEIKWKHLFISGGGILRELGQHLIDVMVMWFGKPKSIYGRNQVIMPGREVEDLSLTVMNYENGLIVNLINNYFDRSSNTYQGTIIGSKGQIYFELSSYDISDSKIIYYDNDENSNKISFEQPQYIDRVYPGHMDSYLKEINDFLKDVSTTSTYFNDLKNIEINMQIISASYESERTKKLINLPLKEFNYESLKRIYKQ